MRYLADVGPLQLRQSCRDVRDVAAFVPFAPERNRSQVRGISLEKYAFQRNLPDCFRNGCLPVCQYSAAAYIPVTGLLQFPEGLGASAECMEHASQSQVGAVFQYVDYQFGRFSGVYYDRK